MSGCETCGGEMLPRKGKYGLFFYCSSDSKHRTVNPQSITNYLSTPKNRMEAHINYDEEEEHALYQAFEDGNFQTF